MKKGLTVFGVLVMLFVLFAVTASAQTPKYQVGRWTVDTGGATSVGESYTVQGLAGQPDVGMLDSKKYTISGGFWSGAVPERTIYLPHLQSQ